MGEEEVFFGYGCLGAAQACVECNSEGYLWQPKTRIKAMSAWEQGALGSREREFHEQ